jgi:hypothetical protein
MAQGARQNQEETGEDVMGNTIVTATGCSRCKIAKKFMNEHAVPFEEMDIKAEG